MKFGLMFFASETSGDPYALLLDAARFADARGFSAVWTPERHFHPCGGHFPNPAVLGAAVAAVTSRIAIRAGSVIAPLHDPIRIAEEWAVIDNLSGGRVGLSFGSGWHADDFALSPARYQQRRESMYDHVAVVRSLWRGEAIRRFNGRDEPVCLRTYPRPRQPELPVWLTSRGTPDTFVSAARLGANVLTNLIAQDFDMLADNVARYRRAWAEAGHAGPRGSITLMLHTLVGRDDATASVARHPLRGYLRTWLALEQSAHESRDVNLTSEIREELLDCAVERYMSSALIGAVDACETLVAQLRERDIDEIACLIDFGPSDDEVMEGLTHLASLAARIGPG